MSHDFSPRRIEPMRDDCPIISRPAVLLSLALWAVIVGAFAWVWWG